MQKKLWGRFNKLNPLQRIGLALLVILVVGLLVTRTTSPDRSVAAYCKVYGQEKARLAALSGSTYSSGVFNESASDAGEFANSFSRLEKVAPKDISSDVASLRSVYQTMHDNPSQAVVAGLSGVSAENSVKDWTKNHCQPSSQ